MRENGVRQDVTNLISLDNVRHAVWRRRMIRFGSLKMRPKRVGRCQELEIRPRRFVPAAMVVCLSANALNFAQAVDPPPRFESAVELVSLNVTVTDQSHQCFAGSPPYWTAGWDGCPVHDLGETAFQITEDGAPQTITLFNRAEVPVAMTVVIDVPSSAKERTSDVHDAARGLTRRLRARDSAVVIP